MGLTVVCIRPGSLYHIEIIDNFDSLKVFRDAWEKLLRKSFSHSFFLTWEWIELWWNTYSSDYEFLFLRASKNGESVGFAPFVVRKGTPGRLEFIGQNKAYGEYLDLLIEHGHEKDVLPAFVTFIMQLRKKNLWGSLSLATMLSESPSVHLLVSQFEKHGISIQRSEPRISPYVSLPDRWEKYLELKGNKFRSQLERNERRLALSGEVKLELPTNESELDLFFDDLVMLHNKRWDTKVDELFFSFHRQLAHVLFPLDRLLLARLRLGKTVVAVRYDFIFADKVWNYQGGWLPEFARLGVGNACLGEVLKYCIEKNIPEYDFLEGDARYKRNWSTAFHESVDLTWGDHRGAYIF